MSEIQDVQVPEALYDKLEKVLLLTDGGPVVHVDSIHLLLEMQAYLQREAYSLDLQGMPDEAKAPYVRDMTLALTDELHEALNEVGWKPWATSRHFNREAFIGELIDALHFLLNLFLLADATQADIISGYLQKNAKNLRRQIDGYDGVAGKCGECKRALDDEAQKGQVHPTYGNHTFCSPKCRSAFVDRKVNG